MHLIIHSGSKSYISVQLLGEGFVLVVEVLVGPEEVQEVVGPVEVLKEILRKGQAESP